MEDIFSSDKFLLLGGKGTGKTAFYKALRDNTFQERLTIKAQKSHKHYYFLDAVSIKSDPYDSRNKYFEISQFDQSQIVDPEFFYRRFWQIFIHQAIFIDETRFGYKNIVSALPITNDTATATRFKGIIFDDAQYALIEKDLVDFDNYLKSQ
jgi:GTPase SAR1 family protein